jgi:hypothetical protein
MFGFKKRRAERQAREQVLARQQLHDALVELIALAKGGPGTEVSSSLILHPGERLVEALSGVGLFEPRRGAGHWSGGSAGFSVPVSEGVRFRVGKTRGHYEQGEEKPTIIDQGDASVTTRRVVFQGGKYTREWNFAKLVGITSYTDQPATAIRVSNREKTSGIVYQGLPVDPVRLKLAVAVAIFEGEKEQVTQELQNALAQLDAGGEATIASLFPVGEATEGKDAVS